MLEPGRLIRELAEIDGLEESVRNFILLICRMILYWLTVMSAIDAISSFAWQSGSDQISQNEPTSRQGHLQVIEKIRNYRPDIAISGDFIVGFWRVIRFCEHSVACR